MRAVPCGCVRAAAGAGLLLASAAVVGGQATAPPPTGTVLFERHATDVPQTPANPQDAAPQTPAEAPATPPAGTSSSVRRRSPRRGLQHHKDSGATPAAAPPAAATAQAPAPCTTAACDPVAGSVSDAERRAPRVLETLLDLHLNLQTGSTDARATLQVRNDSDAPMTTLPLQISSSLQWQSARLVGETGQPASILPVHQHNLVTDADHTGSATELVLLLPKPLLPGQTVTLDLFYGGMLGSSAQRLLRLGAPADRAAIADWDTVSDRFTGLRGFGNVLWLPVAAPPALLASGPEFVAAVQRQKVLTATSRLGVRLTVETAGTPPGTAFVLGRERPLMPVLPPAPATDSAAVADADASHEGESRLYQAEWAARPVGATVPSLFVTAAPVTGTAVRVATENTAVADAVLAASDRIRPMLEEWLGPRPAQPLHVVDLPLAGAQPFAADALLVVPLGGDPASRELAAGLVSPMAEAWLPADVPAWFAEGLPEFFQLLYAERTGAREAASATLRAARATLAQAESGSATAALRVCADPVCARTKGASVFAMLRQIAGDAALKQALTGWLGSRLPAAGRHDAPPAPLVSSSLDVAQEGSAATDATATDDAAIFERLLQRSSGKDLQWFFTDWIDHDAGLPDLAIVQVAPRHVERGTVSNTVPSQRRPVGGPIGAEPVPQPGGPAEQESATAASRNSLALPDGSWLIAVEVQNNGAAAAEVPVTVRGSGLQNTLPLRVPAHGRATVRVPFETAPEEVTVNDGTTPEQRLSTHRRTIALPANVR